MTTKKLDIIDYKEKGKDVHDRTIEKILYRDDNQLVIYFVKNDYLNAYARMSPEFTGSKASKKYNQKRAELEKYILYLDHNPKINNEDFEYIRINEAYAIKMYTIGNHAASVQYIQNIIDEIRKDVIVPQKLEFIIGSGILTLLLVSFAFFIYYFNYFSDKTFFRQAIFCMSFSSLGNLFFYLVKMFETEDSQNNFGLYQGYLNFSKSAISGLIIYTLIKSELLLGNFSDNILSMVTFSLISGFSDDIPVKVIMRLSKTITGDDEETKEAEIPKDEEPEVEDVTIVEVDDSKDD